MCSPLPPRSPRQPGLPDAFYRNAAPNVEAERQARLAREQAAMLRRNSWGVVIVGLGIFAMIVSALLERLL